MEWPAHLPLVGGGGVTPFTDDVGSYGVTTEKSFEKGEKKSKVRRADWLRFQRKKKTRSRCLHKKWCRGRRHSRKTHLEKGEEEGVAD